MGGEDICLAFIWQGAEGVLKQFISLQQYKVSIGVINLQFAEPISVNLIFNIKFKSGYEVNSGHFGVNIL